MKKQLLTTLIIIFFNCLLNASTLDISSVLGFGGFYKENSWTPLIIRIKNNNKSVRGNLIVEIDNSSTSTSKKRKYIKPVDLPAGADKKISFVLPIGYYSDNITVSYITDDSILYKEIIKLKQKGVRENFILGVSPYPDLGNLSNHGKTGYRIVSYPHLDNLPDNSNAYNSVDIISIHRELFDKLSINQYRAIKGWISMGGTLAVWGGKSPSPSKWDLLPSQINGLKHVNTIKNLSNLNLTLPENHSLLLNIIETDKGEVVLNEEGFDLISKRELGLGTVFFISFDYSGTLRNWNGFNSIWDLIFDSENHDNKFQQEMENPFVNEDFISIFDSSGFAYMKKMNLFLILFLSASVSASMLILISLRKKNIYIKYYIPGLLMVLLIISLFIYISLFKSSLRLDSSIISVNILDHTPNSSNALLYKDILIGSSNKSTADLSIINDNKSVLLQNNNEDLTLFYSPELTINQLKLEKWSSKILRLRSTVDSIIKLKE